MPTVAADPAVCAGWRFAATAALLVLATLFSSSGVADSQSATSDRRIVFFPTSARLDADRRAWTVPVRGWVFDDIAESRWRAAVIESLPGLLGIDPDPVGQQLFEQRGRMFLVDNLPDVVVTVATGGGQFRMDPSQRNGHFQGELSLPVGAGGVDAQNPWARYRVSGDSPGAAEGASQLVAPSGWSVISDIDDTIKVSNVHDRRELLTGTFLEPFRAVEGMVDLYRKWAGDEAVFHYLSASPWQLYPALSEFMKREGFPDGSFHLKNFRIKDQSFFDLFSSQFEYKLPAIERLLLAYPGRRFVLVGDGGESDPEIFVAVARAYPSQVVAVLIRDRDAMAPSGRAYSELFEGLPGLEWRLFETGDDLLALDFGVPNPLSGKSGY